ncbi:MAG: MFS transporter [Chloroflexi bacterium]|nr:MAG: MFS transporter [Chloroflexota bacterium]
MNTTKDDSHLPGYATRWPGLVFIGISLFVISLDNLILNVAIPSISRDLGAAANELQWIVDAYILVFASLLLTMGAIGDRFGRKKLLQLGLIWFGVGSLAATLSTSTDALMTARAFLGVGSAMIMPATLSIISATFPPHERPKAIAIWTAINGVGIGLGPALGGLLLEWFEWNAVFYINLPIVAVALLGGGRFLADSKDPNPPKVDIPGVVLSITGLFALTYAIIEAGVASWAADRVLFAFGGAAVLLTIFLVWEARSPEAMLPLHFFKNMSFTGANLALVLVFFSLFGSTFFFNQYVQSVLGHSALEAGLMMLPMALVLALVAASSARVAARLGAKLTVALGIAIAGTGLLMMSQVYDLETSIPLVVAPTLALACGMGLAMSPATNSIMGSIPVSKAGIGSAMNDTNRQLGGALGVAILGTIMNAGYLDGIQRLQDSLPVLPGQVFAAISNSVQAAHIVVQDPHVPSFAREAIVSAANRAFVDGMTQAIFVGSLLMFAAALLTLAILPARVRCSADAKTTDDAETPLPTFRLDLDVVQDKGG